MVSLWNLFHTCVSGLSVVHASAYPALLVWVCVRDSPRSLKAASYLALLCFCLGQNLPLCVCVCVCVSRVRQPISKTSPDLIASFQHPVWQLCNLQLLTALTMVGLFVYGRRWVCVHMSLCIYIYMCLCVCVCVSIGMASYRSTTTFLLKHTCRIWLWSEHIEISLNILVESRKLLSLCF